jgi:hypothetical protein
MSVLGQNREKFINTKCSCWPNDEKKKEKRKKNLSPSQKYFREFGGVPTNQALSEPS